MATLQFMPWCRIGKTYSVGEIVLVPFETDGSPETFDAATTSKIKAVLSSYKDIEGHPVRESAVVQYGTKSPLDDLTDDELELTREYSQLACFSGLANREYFNQLGPYCNSDCFTLYGQRFEDLTFVAITTRRREGRTLDGRPLANTAFSIPVHVSSVRQVSLDKPLLAALLNFRIGSSATEWSRWQNAISCFNQANTDNDSIRYQVEWVLLASAFEHLLHAKPNAEDVAQKFAKAMVPQKPLSVGIATRQSKQWADKNKHLRHEWMREFYRIRGDFAHGKLNTQQPTVWNPLEHIVLATIAFPLVVRSLLAEGGNYALTDEYKAQTNVFEQLADEQFLNPPDDQTGSIDSVWSRMRHKAKLDLAFQKIAETLKAADYCKRRENWRYTLREHMPPVSQLSKDQFDILRRRLGSEGFVFETDRTRYFWPGNPV